MFVSTSTDISQVGAVASSLIGDISTLLYIICGILFSFWVLEILINAVRKKE